MALWMVLELVVVEVEAVPFQLVTEAEAVVEQVSL